MSKTFSWYELLLPRCRRDVKQHWNAQLKNAQQARQDVHGVVLLVWFGVTCHADPFQDLPWRREKEGERGRESVCVCVCVCAEEGAFRDGFRPVD